MSGKVSKYLKTPTYNTLVPSVHFKKQRTDSVENLVVEDDAADDEEIQVTPKGTRVDIIVNDASNPNDEVDVNEENSEPEITKPKKTIWNFLKWLWAHMRIRKWVGRSLQAFGQGFMYASPVSATVVMAQELNRHNGSKYHQTHVF